MNKALEYFYELSKIPRVSGNESNVVKYINNLLTKNGVKTFIDKKGNLYAYKNPSSNKKPILLQAHVDMVGVKTDNSSHNFDKDPIAIVEKDGWISAKNTTLGSDDGSGVAIILAILLDKTLDANVEALFTVEEETSLSGANAVLPNKFKSKHLINIDTENDKEIIIGSASTASYEITCPVVKTANKDQCYCLNVFGGVSGHSGASIHHTISNVIVDVSSILLTLLKKYQFNLVSINAGTAKNAIPSSIEVKFSTKENINEFKKSFTNLFQEYKNTYAIYEKNLDFSISKIKNIPQSFNKSSTFKVLNLICSIFNGMSQYDFDLKLTLSSSNIGVVKTENKAVIMSVLARSSFAFSDKLLQNRIESVVRLANASVKQAMYFPGAPAIKDNAVAKLIANVAKTKFKHHMEINAIHAGLEFGIISTKYPGLSYASIGPNITGEHTVKERMELKSFEFIYKLIRETIKNFN